MKKPVKIALAPEDALRALLKVDLEADPLEDDPAPPHDALRETATPKKQRDDQGQRADH